MTGFSIATIRYSMEVTNAFTQALSVGFSAISTFTVTALLVSTIVHAFVLRDLFPNDISIAITRNGLSKVDAMAFALESSLPSHHYFSCWPLIPRGWVWYAGGWREPSKSRQRHQKGHLQKLGGAVMASQAADPRRCEGTNRRSTFLLGSANTHVSSLDRSSVPRSDKRGLPPRDPPFAASKKDYRRRHVKILSGHVSPRFPRKPIPSRHPLVFPTFPTVLFETHSSISPQNISLLESNAVCYVDHF
ncbi:hypothetical protein B296_00057470 [Ensete ventricosum]|uniref:Uncharacterized protein n=1 Tax=Ensete ventricosum TaxID=4639 RepID=A0A426XQX2_ENSVE|nr:hypothetical protein B296_00057470 [Ensete ventricosum]